VGPIRCGVSRDEPWVQRAGQWIKSVQKPDGSFGESADSYEETRRAGRGPSTASQTAWGAMILQEIYGPDDPDLRRAIEWLGSWSEPWFTGTGFPRVFYLRYHLYRLYFPIMALGRYLAAHGMSLAPPARIKLAPKAAAHAVAALPGGGAAR
jgi:squalene-hopene/tetraprenyl-beta-curcumene cyclase